MSILKVQGIPSPRLTVLRAAIDAHTPPKQRNAAATDAEVVNDYVAHALEGLLVETETRLAAEVKRAETRQDLKSNPL